MKCISLWQPWASLYCSGAKVHETRSWSTNYRGPLAIHAAKIIVKTPPELEPIVAVTFGEQWRTSLHRGGVVGVVNLVDIYPSGSAEPASATDALCGNFNEGRWLWKREEFVLFTQQVVMSGRQGLFDISDRLLPQEYWQQPWAK